MAFETGQPRPEKGGRKPGSLNKNNQEIQDLAQELGCNPAKILMMIAMGDREGLGRKYIDENGEEQVVAPIIDLDQRKDAAKDLMPYLYGKRKPIDSKGDDSSDPISELVNAFRNK